MKLSEIKNIISSATSIRVHYSLSANDATNEKYYYSKFISVYDDIDIDYDIEYIYPREKDLLDVFVVNKL